MTEITTFINATAVLSVGYVNRNDKTALLLPFYSVELYNGLGKVKRVLVNYTFGKAGFKNKPVEYEGDVGTVKERLFHCIVSPSVPTVHVIKAKNKEQITKYIVKSLWDLPPDSKVLYVFDSKIADDVPIFEALGLLQDGKFNPYLNPPVTLAELGLKIEEPFMEITREELNQVPQTAPIIKMAGVKL